LDSAQGEEEVEAPEGSSHRVAHAGLAPYGQKTRSRPNRRGIMAGPNEREQMDTSARLRDWPGQPITAPPE
jgi:hypothetical protein